MFAQSAPTPKKNSVEDIFIWKVSDELKLSASEEKKFSDIHRELNKQKIQLATQLQKLSFQSKEDPQLSKARAAEVIKDYKKTLTAYNNLSLQELDKVKALLGDKKFLDYLAIKQDINLKLKSLVLGDEPSKAKQPAKLPPPQIIEEK
ncbi:MAG: hypothetical protein NDI63_11100 [Pseudobdellovibrio sp.]|nr:hypothetical protein [Pseudobdellovibrio sp.]